MERLELNGYFSPCPSSPDGWAQYLAQDPETSHHFMLTLLPPNCRAWMWDHYGRKDWINACGHGCLKQISPGPFPGGNVPCIERGLAGRGLIGLPNIEAVGKEEWAAKKESKDTKKGKGSQAEGGGQRYCLEKH